MNAIADGASVLARPASRTRRRRLAGRGLLHLVLLWLGGFCLRAGILSVLRTSPPSTETSTSTRRASPPSSVCPSC